MTEPLTWPAVVSKLIDNLPAILAALAGCLAYLQSRRNAVHQAAGTALVAARADTQDIVLEQIHEATNGGVQLLRDKLVIASDRIDDLEKLVKRMVDAQQGPVH